MVHEALQLRVVYLDGVVQDGVRLRGSDAAAAYDIDEDDDVLVVVSDGNVVLVDQDRNDDENITSIT